MQELVERSLDHRLLNQQRDIRGLGAHLLDFRRHFVQSTNETHELLRHGAQQAQGSKSARSDRAETPPVVDLGTITMFQEALTAQGTPAGPGDVVARVETTAKGHEGPNGCPHGLNAISNMSVTDVRSDFFPDFTLLDSPVLKHP